MFSNLMMGLALLKNYNPFKAPKSFTIMAMLKKFDKSFALTGKNYGIGVERRKDPWNFLFVAGMWFQDLFNYDFRRTEMCIIPYGTQEGEISFLRVQYWNRLEKHSGKNASECNRFTMVQKTWQTCCVCQWKGVPMESTDHRLKSTMNMLHACSRERRWTTECA